MALFSKPFRASSAVKMGGGCARLHEYLLDLSPGALARSGKGLPGEIDAITGATISSKVVVSIINNGIADWQPLLQQTDLTQPKLLNTRPEEAP